VLRLRDNGSEYSDVLLTW